jgi:hypothetical protein
MSLWNRTHNLDRMTLPELVRAFFTYPAIWTYLGLSAVSVALILRWMEQPGGSCRRSS